MFEIVRTFYQEHSDFINGAASIVTLFGFAFGIKSYLQSRQKKIFYQWIRTIKIPPYAPPGYDVNVSYKEVTGSSLTTDVVTISNRTDVTLTDRDFVGPIRIPYNPQRKVYQSEVVNFSNGSTAKLDYDDNHICLRELQIPRSESVTIFLSHDDSFDKRLIAVPKSLPELIERRFKKPSETLIGTILFIILFISIVTVLEPFLTKPLTFVDFTGWGRLSYVVFLPFLGFIFLYLFLVWLPPKLDPLLRPILGISKEELFLSERVVTKNVEDYIFFRDVNESKQTKVAHEL